MNTPVIRVQNLAKQYHLGQRQAAYATFREALSSAAVAPWRRFRRLAGHAAPGGAFWALDDVSFDVRPGEVVGIIGRNGAGKSTLLKILSRITEPTRGRVELTGRVASLLEVGTGFHPELTGRENIYLNGAILGMSRREIHRKFAEIVDFAEIERFLDTPVKHYSSGMYVRLAFSVAAHLEPEILIVDEVLAVGDQAFQRKCLGKMSGVASSGRTILFVSHNMAAVQALCSSALILDAGRVLSHSDTETAVAAYCSSVSAAAAIPVAQRTDRTGTGAARLVHAACLDPGGAPTDLVQMGDDLEFLLVYDAVRPVYRPQVGIIISTTDGRRVTRALSSETHGDLPRFSGSVEIRCHLTNLNLCPGRYHVTCGMSDSRGDNVDRLECALQIDILPKDISGTGKSSDTRTSLCFFPARWRIRSADPVLAD